MTTRPPALLLLGVVVCCLGAVEKPPVAAQAAKPADAAGKPAESKAAASTGANKAKEGKEDAKAREQAACMHCGATCCLTPVCVCEPGTKKKTNTEFETVCEPLCVPGCGSRAWCFGRGDAPGCTDCGEEECRCPGRTRYCKRLKKKTVDEEVPKITRRVAYVCDCCAGRCGPGCRRGAHTCRAESWWCRMTWWWPR